MSSEWKRAPEPGTESRTCEFSSGIKDDLCLSESSCLKWELGEMAGVRQLAAGEEVRRIH